MTAYYNDINKHRAAWLGNLSTGGAIAPGVVTTKDVWDIEPQELIGYEQAHFFAGIGAWSHALRLAGWADSQRVWTGSCPCQPFSESGKGKGFADERHLWPAWFYLIEAHRPPVIFGEQVASPAGIEWLDLVQGDMEACDYTFWAVVLAAGGAGAPHQRERIFWVAYSDHYLGWPAKPSRNVRNRAHAGWAQGAGDAAPCGQPVLPQPWADCEWLYFTDGRRRAVERGAFPLVDGSAANMAAASAYGDAIVAPLAAQFIRTFMELC